jgi:hypothetical protein
MGIRTRKGHTWTAKEVRGFLWRFSARAQRVAS